jgi:hypothetical protein
MRIVSITDAEKTRFALWQLTIITKLLANGTIEGSTTRLLGSRFFQHYQTTPTYTLFNPHKTYQLKL